jgi:hypothetical protein
MATVGMTLKQRIFEAIQTAAVRPTDLVINLEKDAYRSEVESSLSELLEDGSVRFEYDGLLHAS